MTKRPSLWLPLIATAAALAYFSCGQSEFNLFQPIAKPLALKTDVKAILEEARVDLDHQRFKEAKNLLQPVVDDQKKDSNQARELYAAAVTGEAGLDIWSLISDIVTSLDKKSKTRTNGVDSIFNSISDSVLGTGAERAAKVTALYDALDALQHAPDPTDAGVSNTSCIYAAFLAVPTITDATTAMNNMETALTQIRDSATSGGTVCPNIGLLDSAATGIATASASFNYILQVASNCSFLNLQQTAAAMNNIEKALSTLTSTADKGCSSLPTCPSAVPNCQSLFPTCVQQALKVGTSDAVAGDGKLASCEIILNCTDPTSCFAL